MMSRHIRNQFRNILVGTAFHQVFKVAIPEAAKEKQLCINIHTIDGHWMTEITHGNELSRNRNEHMEINLSKQKKKIWSPIYQISVIHLINLELTPENVIHIGHWPIMLLRQYAIFFWPSCNLVSFYSLFRIAFFYPYKEN
jgi:hypothetical protein